MYIDMKRPESCAKCPLLKRSWLRGERCALKGGPEACPLRDEMEPRLLAYSEAMAADVVWMERRGSMNLQVMMPTWIDGELCLMGCTAPPGPAASRPRASTANDTASGAAGRAGSSGRIRPGAAKRPLRRRREGDDRMALLKAQEPRVLTLKEVRALQDGAVVWLEDHDKVDTIPAIVNHVWNSLPNIVSFTSANMREVKADMLWYGVNWRCWTLRPTDEQREMIEWE